MTEKRRVKPIVIFIFIFIFLISGFFLLKYSHNIDKEIVVNYSEKSNIDFKVYLKDNSFFETPYLEKNRTYIASLIDYILIDYDYTLDVSDNVSGTYSYYIKGTVSANKSNSKDYYWSKDYLLSEKITKEYTDTNQVKIDAETKVNYQVYNNLLNDFKSQYGVTMDGVLNVSLVIENTISSDIVERNIEKDSNVELNIPLTTLTVEVPIETSDLNNEGTLISETIKQNVFYFTVIKYLGYSCFGLSFILFIILMLLVIFNSKNGNKYNKILRKILKTYDNIIVNASDLPNMDELSIVSVTSFDELIDAHGEVRKPINYVDLSDRAVFVLINDGMAWRFDLMKDTYKKRKNK